MTEQARLACDEIERIANGLRSHARPVDAGNLLAALRTIREDLPPEGWVLVPKEPTAEMVARGWNENLRVYAGAEAAKACWYAMLAAAQPPKIREELDRGSEWVVWAHEHEGYWPSSRCGYVRNLREAGRFSFAEALAIVTQGNYGMIGSAPEETMMPAPAQPPKEQP